MTTQIKIPPNHNWTRRHKPDTEIKNVIYLVLILALTLTFYVLVA